MQGEIYPSEPVFELEGSASKIDLSAWISGLSFVAGFWIADLSRVASDISKKPELALIMLAAFAAFFGIILLIQNYMKFSLRATSYGQPNNLVTGGIFQYSRNPIYVAFLLPLASIGVFSVGAALAAIILYIGAMNATIIRTEELHLLGKFGKDYKNYLARAPRWLLV